MSTPWTPGPWHISGTHPRNIHIGAKGSPMVLASMNEVHINTPANARLISAAPEMAEVLERMTAPFAKWDDGALPEALALLARIKRDAS
jgi:hypothetical protein